MPEGTPLAPTPKAAVLRGPPWIPRLWTPIAGARGPRGWRWYTPRMDLASLPEEVKELVRAQIEAGHFRSVDEVVCEALRLLHEREELFASQREELRAQIAEGVAAEERGELRDGEEAVGDVRRRIDERLRSGE